MLAGLRAIDPQAELVHLGGSSWLLGVRGPNPAAVKRLAQMMKVPPVLPPGLTDDERATLEVELATQLQVMLMMATGFKGIQMYTVARPTHAIVKDFEGRDHNWRVRPKEAFQELKEAASLDAGNAKRVARLREHVQAESKDMFRFLMKKAKGFLQSLPMPGRAATPAVSASAPAVPTPPTA